jgi:coproporphyrinogen III oxidase
MSAAAAAAPPPAATASQPVDAAQFEQFLLDTQAAILRRAEELDGSGQRFLIDRWERGADNAGAL